MIRPLGKYIAILPEEEKQASPSGILLPDMAKRKPTQGTVVAVGCNVEELSVGDVVVYSKYTGTNITVGDDDYVVIDADNVLAIVG